MNLKEWNEIKYILWDFDLTLGDTQEVFRKWHGIARLYLAYALGIELKEVENRFNKYWREGHRILNVDPEALIPICTGGFRNAYPGVAPTVWREFEGLLDRTYREPIKLFDDVIPVFEQLKARNIEMGVVSHSRKWWSQDKIEWTGIGPYIKYGNFFNLNVRFQKVPWVWRDGAYYYRFDENNTIVVGDNLQADANAAAKENFYEACWLVRKNELETALPIREGVKHERVVTVTDLYQVRDLVILNNEKRV